MPGNANEKETMRTLFHETVLARGSLPLAPFLLVGQGCATTRAINLLEMEMELSAFDQPVA